MKTTVEMLGQWFDRGLFLNSTHMIIVCDEYDYDNYPVYVSLDESAYEVAEAYDKKSMQRVVEVYNLAMDKNEQLAQVRVRNF